MSHNGASYDVLMIWCYNAPSTDGTQTFQRFWSVRNPKKQPGGSISGIPEQRVLHAHRFLNAAWDFLRHCVLEFLF